jgi:pimeloyl-ACP methyl ester carboxylesterase
MSAGAAGLAWRSVGAGPKLLLVNGYAATGEDWDPSFLSELAESYEVICPDNRGLRGSALGDLELSIDSMAADLEALLDSLRIERLPVVGWSMGGFVAQRLAVRSPERVTALALIATDPGAPDSVPPDPEVWSRLVDLSGTPEDQASRLIHLLFPPELAADIDRRFGGLVATARAELSAETLRAQEYAMDTWHRDGQPRPADPGKPPTLIVHGSEDIVIPAANARALADRWLAGRVEIFAGCGHAVMAQDPQRVVALIRGLLDHIDR